MSQIRLAEGTVPAAPGGASRVLFASSDGVYALDSAGGTTRFGAGGAGGGIAASGGTQVVTSGTLVFSNSNGLTFGISNSSVLTASHNGLTSQTVQTQSNVQGLSAGTQVGRTGDIVLADSNGISFGLSGSTRITASYTVPSTAGLISAVNFSAGTTSGNLAAVTFSNSNGVTFGLNAGTMTASHNGLTTAAASNHSHGNPTLALTNLSGTTASNSAGLTLSLSAAAGGGGADGYNILAAGTQTAATTGTVLLQNSNGITFGMSNSSVVTASHNGITSQTVQTQSNVQGVIVSNTTYRTGDVSFSNANGISFGSSAGQAITASYTVPSTAGLLSAVRVSAGTTSNNLSALTFNNANGITFGLNASTITASHNGLTTARASNDGVGLATAQTNVTWTVNSAGISLNLSGHAGTGTTFAGANLSGSMTLNSNGLNLSMSAAAPGGGGAINVSAGTTSNNLQTVVFSNSNGVTFGLNGSTITASAAGGGGAAPTMRYATSPWAADNVALITNITALSQRPIFVPFQVMGDLTANEIMWKMSRSTSGSNNFTLHFGIYSYVNTTQISLIGSNSHSWSNTATASISGVRMFEASLGTDFSSLTAGQYIAAFIFSNTASASANYSLMGGTTLNPHVGVLHAGADSYATHTSHQPIPLHGRYSTTTGALPNSVGQSQVIGQFTGASLAPPMGFTIGVDN